MTARRFLALWLAAWVGGGLGGWWLSRPGGPAPMSPPDPIIRPGTEAAIDEATCRSRIWKAVVEERRRVTGRVNPPAWTPDLDLYCSVRLDGASRSVTIPWATPLTTPRDHGVAP